MMWLQKLKKKRWSCSMYEPFVLPSEEEESRVSHDWLTSATRPLWSSFEIVGPKHLVVEASEKRLDVVAPSQRF